MKKIELLAPAGDLTRLKIAFKYGADAVYLGGEQFSLRANAKNFSLEEIKEAVDYAHSIDKKVYVAVNIIFHNQNLDGLDEYLQKLALIKVDAVIASDIVVVQKINELNLPLEIHISTQASNLNYESVKFWQGLNAKRVVLARECHKDDIKKIKDETGVDIECFIHGAMCSSISGKCVLSNYVTKRDSNRGGCAQICRWNFGYEDDKPDFSIMPKDLNMVNHIKEMIDVGVNSFKIEGRMRSIYYIATVVLVYRRIIDKTLDNTITSSELNYYLNILNRCANRDSVAQFFQKLPTNKEQYYADRDEASNQDFLGLVMDYDKENKLIKLEQRNYFKLGDIVEVFGPKTETFTLQINKIYNKDKEEIDVARHPKMICYIPCDTFVNQDDMIRIKVFDKNDFV